MSKSSKKTDIPVFKLYGENHRWPTPDLLHCETFTDRIQSLNWEIKPHRHTGLVQIFYIQTGSADVQLDNQRHSLGAGTVLVVAEMGVHGFKFTQNITGHILTLASPLVNQLLSRLPQQQALKESACYPVSNEAHYINDLFQQLNVEYYSQALGRELLLEALVAKMIIWISRRAMELSISPDTQMDSGSKHFAKFSQLLERDYHSHQAIDVYAAELGITAPHLNSLCRRLANQSALQMIHERLLLEAKRNLIYTVMSISEISDKLGFSEPAYFTRFFKRHSQLSPKAFRLQASNMQDDGKTN